MQNIRIRPATENDVGLIMHFIQELAIYEEAEHEFVATKEQIHQSIFHSNDKTKALICEVDGESAGFSVYFNNYSTWLGKQGLFLEDLYVSPKFRGCGAGKALLAHLARICIDNGYGRFEWNVLDWNKPAIDFYESLGAKPQSEWIGYRLTGDALAKLADS